MKHLLNLENMVVPWASPISDDRIELLTASADYAAFFYVILIRTLFPGDVESERPVSPQF